MLSFLTMQCPECGSEYTLSIEELNVLVLFKCFECGRHNVYVAGHVLMLDNDIMNEGAEDEKRRHIVETVQLFALDFAGNVLNAVDRVINVNMEIDMPQARRSKKKTSTRKRDRATEMPAGGLCPSVKLKDAPEISFEEVQDFRKIDLNLIDKREFFDKFFGARHN